MALGYELVDQGWQPPQETTPQVTHYGRLREKGMA